MTEVIEYIFSGVSVTAARPTRGMRGANTVAACVTLIALMLAGAPAIAEPAQPPTGDAGVWTAPAPLSPEESLKTIVVPNGFAVELVAAEPLVMDPVAFAWGPDMRLWVVEMADYNWLPINDKSPQKPKGRVVYLTDANGDGKYDTRTVFLDNLDYPTGVLPWRNGVLVTAAPDILYAEDTTAMWVADDEKAVEKGAKPSNFRLTSRTGGKADKIDKLYTGFAEGNPQLRVNGLQWGLDNWIYCANGLSNGVVKSNKTGQTIDIRGRDIRFRPDTGEIEPASGPSQFGRVRDDFGNWFGVDNSRLIIHYELEDHHLRRNPHVAPPEPFIDLVTPRNPPCFPIGKKVERLHAPYMANRFTSACGIAVYRDNYLGDDVYGQVFICEPVHNLITRRKLTPDGVTFKAERLPGEEQKEFLASSDEWFRPVHLRTGPDGALYIADMYRAVVEHPQWLPKEFNKKVDWMQGSDKGRIYRVVRKGVASRKVEPLHKLNSPDIVARLGSTCGAERDLAQAALIDRHREAAATSAPDRAEQLQSLAAQLRKLAVDRSHPSSSRVQALSTLAALGEAKVSDINAAVASDDPELVRFGIRLCENLPADKIPDAFLILSTSRKQYGARIDFELAMTLGRFTDPVAGKMLAAILNRHPDDPYITAAVVSSFAPHLEQIIAGVISQRQMPLPLIDAAAATAAGLSERAAIVPLIKSAMKDERGYYVLAVLFDRLAAKRVSLKTLTSNGDAALDKAMEEIGHQFQQARIISASDGEPIEMRKAAVRLLAYKMEWDDRDPAFIIALVHSAYPAELQVEAVNAILRLDDAKASELLLDKERWKGLGPKVRQLILDAMIRRDLRALALLNAVKAGWITPGELTGSQRQALTSHTNPAIREAAGKLITSVSSSRASVLDAHQAVLKLAGDPVRGQPLFEKTCAVCHKIAGIGKGFGPDLGALSDRSPQSLLTAILDPNQAVDPRYLNYVAETSEDSGGETFTGMLLAETATGITLVGADGVKRTILRKDVASLRSTSLSLMPEGLEQGLGKQGLADVIAFVASRSQPARVLDGVKASLIKPNADGSLVLPATACDAFGKTITYEKEDNNLGLWSSADDFAAWTIEPRAAGKFEVWLDYASDKTWLNNSAAISAENDEGHASGFTAKIESTGTFNDYQQSKVGTVELSAGRQRLIIRPSGPITGRLMDLRGVRLVPVK